jgi:DNA modification methylase
MTPYYSDAAVTLYLGNCLHVLPSVVGAALLMTDPPYNVSARGVGGRANTTIGRVPRKDGTMREIVRDFGEWDHGWNPEPFLSLVGAVLRDGGSLVSFTSEFLMGPYLRTGLEHRSLLFWRKTNPAPNFRKQIVRAAEMAVWQTKGGGWTFNAGGYCPNVWEGPSVNGYTCENTAEKRIHPTQKPEWLMERWVALFSDPGDLVVDPHAGSGTTLVAAKRYGRRAVGVELNERYAEEAAKRLEVTDVDERTFAATDTTPRGKQGSLLEC